MIGSATIAASCFFLFHEKTEFKGSRTATDDIYELNIESMNGLDEHHMMIEENNFLHVFFMTDGGSLTLDIKAPNGDSCYSGNGKALTDFILKTEHSGSYQIQVKARKARGQIRIKKQNTEDSTQQLNFHVLLIDRDWCLFHQNGLLPPPVCPEKKPDRYFLSSW